MKSHSKHGARNGLALTNRRLAATLGTLHWHRHHRVAKLNDKSNEVLARLQRQTSSRGKTAINHRICQFCPCRRRSDDLSFILTLAPAPRYSAIGPPSFPNDITIIITA